MNPSQPYRTHDRLWDSRLQDCLDDRLQVDERVALDAHLSACSPCRTRRDDLKHLDQALRSWAGRPALDASFDSRVLELIDKGG